MAILHENGGKEGRKIRDENSPDKPREYRSEFRFIIAGYVRLYYKYFKKTILRKTQPFHQHQ